MALREIAVGIDDSASATDALAWALGLASSTDAAVLAIHAWQTAFVCTYPGLTPSPDESTRHARSVVRSAIASVGVAHPVESIILHGAAGPALTAEAAVADLLVIGRTGENLVTYKPKFGELMTGATARYCVNHATSAVAAVPAGSPWVEAPQVVVGIDGSPASLAALQWATTKLPANASIHALMAVNLASAEFGVPVDAELLDPVVDHQHEQLRKLVAANVDESFLAAGRSVHTHAVVGFAQDALTDPGFPCDLIVIGEHGDTAAAPGVLGSVADHTLRHAEVPLIVVPA